MDWNEGGGGDVLVPHLVQELVVASVALHGWCFALKRHWVSVRVLGCRVSTYRGSPQRGNHVRELVGLCRGRHDSTTEIVSRRTHAEYITLTPCASGSRMSGEFQRARWYA